MNISEYERQEKARYEKLARLVKDILDSEIRGRHDLPRVQALQARSKDIESLRRKLEKRGMAEADDIQDRIKDLAGSRIILYSDMDVERFLQSRIIIDCFHIHWDETKAHYPNKENDGVKYEGFHYVVSLSEAAAQQNLEFAGLRCEIQIQTLLAHAFAESSHDIIYKDEDTPGFGTKVREDMRKRLNGMVEKYLKPAGYELDKVQGDFERLARGQKLFKEKELDKLGDVADNNELYERLFNVSEYLIPHFDDLSAVAPEINRALCAAVEAARERPTVDLDIGGHKTAGHNAEYVTRLAVQTLSEYRFADVESTLDALIRLYKGEPSREIRQQIIGVVEKLAGYNLQVWRQVGPNLQLYLADRFDAMSPEGIEEIRPVATAVWRELLGWNIDGTTWNSTSVQISQGAVPSSEPLKDIRKLAIEGLAGLLDRSKSDDERLPIISAFWEAAQLPMQASYSNESLQTAITDLTTVADILLQRLRDMEFPLWQHIESHLFREYKRFNALAQAEDDKMGCREQARALVNAIKSIRNGMNRKRAYVRYKTLVGFEGVFSQQWDDDAFGFEQVEQFRKNKAATFVEEINAANEGEWVGIIKTCAATKSNDWATFPVFGEFMCLLGERKPDVVLRVIEQNDANVLNFMPSMLAGLAKSSAKNEYGELLNRYIDGGVHLSAIARQYRFNDAVTIDDLRTLFESAVAHGDDIAVIECLIVSIVKWPSLGSDVVAAVSMPALRNLTGKSDCRWVRGAWFLPGAKDFLAALTEEQTKTVLENLAFAGKIDHENERIITLIARSYPGLVWRFFRDRLLNEGDQRDPAFDAIPYQLYDIPKVLGRDPHAAMVELRSWYRHGDNLFQFTGGRLLRAIFPTCTKELAEAAMTVAAPCTNDDIDFILHCFRPYRGESALHPVAKMLVSALPEGDARLGTVEILLENTGVVSGEYGMADAMRERKSLMKPWLEDENAKVRAFAQRTLKRLDNRIATETREADARKERRKRDYGEE